MKRRYPTTKTRRSKISTLTVQHPRDATYARVYSHPCPVPVSCLHLRGNSTRCLNAADKFSFFLLAGTQLDQRYGDGTSCAQLSELGMVNDLMIYCLAQAMPSWFGVRFAFLFSCSTWRAATSLLRGLGNEAHTACRYSRDPRPDYLPTVHRLGSESYRGNCVTASL
jgi:hypothetical protein